MPTVKARKPIGGISQAKGNEEDARFRALLTPGAWAKLHPAIQRRFSKRVADCASVVYVGHINELRKNLPGKVLCHALRLIGAPLPVGNDVDVPSVVSVTEDVASGGQVWTRLYANRTCFPQVIHSAKRFGGPTGLEEYVGFGICMALIVDVEDNGLVFRSAGYRFKFGRLSFTIPKFLHPGSLTVRHKDVGKAESNAPFEFSMTLNHWLFGELVHQSGIYREERQ